MHEKNTLPKWCFFLGDNAFPAACHMLVPASRSDSFDDCNFEQSSNRMHIECAFGMLVNKWATLWQPLKVKFQRRVPLINSCFFLHNFCIDRRMMMDDKLHKCSSYVKVQPSIGNVQPVWSKRPRFDKDGRPVEHLNWNLTKDKIISNNLSTDDKFYHRDMLMKDIEYNFLSRPMASKKRKRNEN